ncbi:MAG: PspC domain-containing protein, partial [Caldithrix sp.]
MADKKKTGGSVIKAGEAKRESRKRIYRSQSDKVIGGVCGGFAEYFNIDALIIRIIWAVAFFVGG